MEKGASAAAQADGEATGINGVQAKSSSGIYSHSSLSNLKNASMAFKDSFM